jgi:hypothetical protein
MAVSQWISAMLVLSKMIKVQADKPSGSPLYYMRLPRKNNGYALLDLS